MSTTRFAIEPYGPDKAATVTLHTDDTGRLFTVGLSSQGPRGGFSHESISRAGAMRLRDLLNEYLPPEED